MRRPTPETVRRWAWSGLLLLIAPKCLLCLAGWLGLLTLLGLGPEICGGP